MEAGERGVPIAKLQTGPHAELVDGHTGIVAKDTQDLADKLALFVREYPASKERLGLALRRFIEKEKSTDVIRVQWEDTFLRASESRLAKRPVG